MFSTLAPVGVDWTLGLIKSYCTAPFENQERT